MRPRKQIILIMLVGLLLVAFAAVMAQDPQTPAQGDQKKTEACCNGDSCSMKKEGETTANAGAVDASKTKDDCCGDSCEMKDKADMKDHKDACCGESCDMSKHDAKHDANMKHDMKDHKDCCNMKQKAKNKKAA